VSLEAEKARARSAALAARAEAFARRGPGQAGRLSEVLAGYRGVPVSGFLPIRDEIDPRAAMAEAAAHGPVGVPVIAGRGQALKFALWEPDMALVPGPFGAAVPEHCVWMEPELLIVPLLAFTRAGGRLGYGGGFYDRTLQTLRARRPRLAVGFAFAAQECESVPLEPTDEPLDLIVTESEVIEPGRS
jgi:5-formyltetrahydrofolate cyclo-ligase